MIVVIATTHAREGKEDKVRDILTALVVESRQEPGNVQYDLLVGEEDPRRFVIYEVWESEAAMNKHLRSTHVSVAHSFADELNDVPPEVVSYRLIEPTRKAHSSGPTRPLEPTDPQP